MIDPYQGKRIIGQRSMLALLGFLGSGLVMQANTSWSALMSRLRLFLLPLALVVELTLLALAWMLAFVKPPAAEAVARWATTRLPSFSWYVGRRAKDSG
ncbi:hypothetical protein R3Q56_006704 [Pseudomonas aeruginosa]|nr:hypothetical protein [Pseudomonas aeruginosa]ELR2942333.1 hypothetical protein [Pseudomonas aeruginosa]